MIDFFLLIVGKSFKLFKFLFISSWVQTKKRPEVSELLGVRNVPVSLKYIQEFTKKSSFVISGYLE